ncbi:hypothetical protein QQ045_012168 [Rhodiola kirilowii]
MCKRGHDGRHITWMGDMFVDQGRQYVDAVTNDNILHLAGRLAPSDRLRIVCGAALQMQRELQWFKEIESIVQPAYKSKRNDAGQTPQQVFSECHKKLLSDAEKWMRTTANSCTVCRDADADRQSK